MQRECISLVIFSQLTRGELNTRNRNGATKLTDATSNRRCKQSEDFTTMSRTSALHPCESIPQNCNSLPSTRTFALVFSRSKREKKISGGANIGLLAITGTRARAGQGRCVILQFVRSSDANRARCRRNIVSYERERARERKRDGKPRTMNRGGAGRVGEGGQGKPIFGAESRLALACSDDKLRFIGVTRSAFVIRLKRSIMARGIVSSRI